MSKDCGAFAVVKVARRPVLVFHTPETDIKRTDRSGAHRPDIVENAARRGNVPVLHELGHRGRVHAAGRMTCAEEPLHLRCKSEPAAAHRKIQWLYPETVTAQVQELLRVVPDSKGEHATEALDRGEPPGAIRTQNDLRSGIAAEPQAVGLQLRANLPKVVDLAVVHDPCLFVRTRHWLVTERRKIENRQAQMSEHESATCQHLRAVVIRTPMSHRGQHWTHGDAGVEVRVRGIDAGNTTHRLLSAAPATALRRTVWQRSSRGRIGLRWASFRATGRVFAEAGFVGSEENEVLMACARDPVSTQSGVSVALVQPPARTRPRTY